eukprot:scaffold3196_cov153-Pinguiococcus_pyrenoidosus.AAC.1
MAIVFPLQDHRIPNNELGIGHVHPSHRILRQAEHLLQPRDGVVSISQRLRYSFPLTWGLRQMKQLADAAREVAQPCSCANDTHAYAHKESKRLEVGKRLGEPGSRNPELKASSAVGACDPTAHGAAKVEIERVGRHAGGVGGGALGLAIYARSTTEVIPQLPRDFPWQQHRRPRDQMCLLQQLCRVHVHQSQKLLLLRDAAACD